MQDPTLEGLFHETLKDIYYAERKLLKALPKMARNATSPDLRAAFEKHQGETEVHVQRLQQVFELMGKRPQSKTCPAIDGIVEEGEEIIDSFKGKPAMDAGLVAAGQAAEHYEIARYGTLRAWALALGAREVAGLLDQTLTEEMAADEKLSKIAERSVNEAAIESA